MTEQELHQTIEQASQRKTLWLYLSNRQISHLPPEIGQLSQLRDLNLSHNQLADLPPEIGHLTNLTRLDLSHNRLTHLPPEIGRLTNLTQLYVHHNQLTGLPELEQLSRLSRLNLSSNQLTDFPAWLGHLTRLTELDLSNNRLIVPPEPKETTVASWLRFLIQIASIDQLVNLTSLNLRNNELTALPLGITKLINLTRLNLGNNQLKSLRPEIGQLTNLVELYLNDNRLQTLPTEISQLPNLQRLYLNDNRLTELPPEIGQLPNLRELYLNNNQLTNLPPEIGQLITLRRLYLRDNRLPSLPTSIQDLTNLQQLGLEGNRLNIPPEILSRTDQPATIINYCLQHQGRTKQPLNEAKMILVGFGSVGKTSLVRRLVENRFDPDEPKTEGIDIQQWVIPVGEHDIRLNIWDFGGQEIMHATHQFFLTRRSLYLVVIDARQGEQVQKLEYWLQLVQSFGGDSPIIIVINKIDAYLLEIDQRGLQQKYPTVRAVIATSCKTGKGIPKLKRQIATEISQLDHIYDELMTSWFAIKTQLEASDKDYLPYSEYIRLCEAQGITRELDQQTLIRLLHDLGVVLSFQDDQRLRDTNILNPEWVTNGVYQILNSNLLFQQRGVLEIDQLNQILDRARYPEHKQLFIMDMMRKFELCFDFYGQADQRFLIPDLLQVQEPYLNWDERRSLNFQYHYQVLPGSVISRFIVRIHSIFTLNIYWRNGVVVSHQRNRALIKADREARQLFISVLGNVRSRRQMLGIIRAHFDHIHATIPKLEVKAVVPLPDFPGVTIDYEDLLRLEERGINKYYYAKADAEIDVLALLNSFKSEVTPVSTVNGDPLASLRARLHSDFPTMDELRIFCYDQQPFLPIYEQPFNSKTEMIQTLVNYAQQIDQLDLLYRLNQ